ncbi:hypothetical protein GCM10011331_12440 [Flavimobilis marinus]|uniref:Uncharacterized protein n=1 Tax=Flavimobilis marinus TaxID=285351 RepID=A0A1I2G4K6_9MICO|nr:hypothetical protein [Flavimobilis marinus]GHG50111.1 hypothetical protein GCM10011331_12440 [Flavimobilis marinus]SFF12565.1 hypothetical protein SAMN04488035_1727 [Flavimobilis marinus]
MSTEHSPATPTAPDAGPDAAPERAASPTPAAANTLGWTLGLLGGAAGAIALFLALNGRSPGNMAGGALAGGATVLVAVAIGRWRAVRRADKAGSTARWLGAVPDERDDDVLTRALAVVGYVAVMASCLAVVLVAATSWNPLAIVGALPALLLGTLVISFAVINRRS